MTELNITLVRDYSLYLALKSAGQGVGEQVTSHFYTYLFYFIS